MKFDDTIAAIATPRGEGGIGIVRVSGSLAIPIACKLFRPSRSVVPSELQSHTLTHGHVIDTFASDEIVDEVLLGVMRAPNTYTTEDIVEFNCHGGFIPVSSVLELVVKVRCKTCRTGRVYKTGISQWET